MKFKIGDKVKHINHGIGIIILEGDTKDSCVVHFGIEPSFGNDIEVSTACLSEVKK